MAGPDRTQALDLTAQFLAEQDLSRAGMLTIVRQLEARAPGKPRVGLAKRPEQSVVDLAQQPVLHFPQSTLYCSFNFTGSRLSNGRSPR